MKGQNRFRQFSIILFCVTLIMLAVHTESMVRFNRQEYRVHGNDSSSDIRMEIDPRADSTSSWLKRSFRLDDGRVVDLNGQTIDGTLRNLSGDTVHDWQLRIDITGDCYINQAWNGEVEIHQFTGTAQEKVQRLNLQDYRLEDVAFEYRYDGDLLIPLRAGDYVIYTPSARFKEMPLSGGDDVRIGMIFYYVDTLDLSAYDLIFHYHRDFTQGITFYPLVALIALLLISLVVLLTGTLAYRRARKDLELRKSGIFSMSDIYDAIYMIHLATGEMTPVSVDDRIEGERPKNRTAKDWLSTLVRQDTDERYRELMLDFVDTDTLAERLKERNSIVCEYISRKYGWCSMRFFAVDHEKGRLPEDVVLAVQNINDERKEQEHITDQISQVESLTRARSVFLGSVVDEVSSPLQRIRDLTGRVMQASADEPVRHAAGDARSISGRLLMLSNAIMDVSGLEAGKLQASSEPYALHDVLSESMEMIRPLAELHRISQSLDAAETLPDRLTGDSRLLREILVNLMYGILADISDGDLHLSVYANVRESSAHLLFSVRADTVLPESVQAGADEPAEPDDGAEPAGLSLSLVSALLAGLGSSLRTVRMPAGRREYYFELDQALPEPPEA